MRAWCLPGCHLAMLSAQTHRTLGIPTRSVLSSLTDPSTFEGALAIAVLGALVAAIIVAQSGWPAGVAASQPLNRKFQCQVHRTF